MGLRHCQPVSNPGVRQLPARQRTAVGRHPPSPLARGEGGIGSYRRGVSRNAPTTLSAREIPRCARNDRGVARIGEVYAPFASAQGGANERSDVSGGCSATPSTQKPQTTPTHHSHHGSKIPQVPVHTIPSLKFNPIIIQAKLENHSNGSTTARKTSHRHWRQ